MKNIIVDDQQKLISRGLNLLSYRPQSIAEFKLKLKRSGADQASINQTIDHFIETGQLDDLKFAKWWVDQRIKFRPRGNRALSFELMQKGISREIISQVLLSQEQEAELAKNLSPQKRLSRGFSRSVVDVTALDE